MHRARGLAILISAFVLLPCLALLAPAAWVRAERPSVLWIEAGWFTFGASEEDLEQARRLCVSERIPSGLRLRGCASDELFGSELPARRVYLSRYGLDRYEVTRQELDRCVASGVCEPSSYATEQPGLTHPSQPAIGLSWAAASKLCGFRGGRLPSEAEWERAARGDSARRFPWGFFYNPALANHGTPSSQVDPTEGAPGDADGYLYLAPSRAFEQAESPHGAVQMAGNVWEWTADSFVPVRAEPLRVDPSVQTDNGKRVVRGGSFRSPAILLRVTHREGRAEAHGFVDVGVRCAYDLARSGSRPPEPP